MTNCLVVDPSEDSCSQICDLLAPYDFTLETELNAEAALERCRMDMPDVVVFSSELNEMDVSAFLRGLNRRCRQARPAALMYCDEADPGEIGRAIWDGASGCMVKPFDARILDDKLHQIGLI